jgi:hypothetical protein
MLIDCGTCTVRGDACADCVVTFLTIAVGGGGAVQPASPQPVPVGLPMPPPVGLVELDDAEQAALQVLARSGLVPPLRLRAV